MLLDQLPAEILQATCSFLSGFETFNFSHVNARTMSVLSEDLFWKNRLQRGTVTDVPSQPRTWKQRYLQARSLQFVDPHSANHYLHGMLLGANRSRLPFAKLERTPPPGSWRGNPFELRTVNSASFSFDVWFCLFPGTVKQSAGGVIYGVQTKAVANRWPGNHPEQFVLVDTKRDLFCSVLNVRKAVARDLKPSCWYHLALTYDVKLKRQDVYLDGENVWSEVGSLHSRWTRLEHGQIGTGFCENTPIAARGAKFPHPRSWGAWYHFYGLVDEFRVWESALTAEAVAELARGGLPKGFAVLGSIKREHDGRGPWTNTKAVRCTRPAEGKNVIIQQRQFQ